MADRTIEGQEDRLLYRLFDRVGGDIFKPVDLQGAGRELGLSTQQMLQHLCSLVAQGDLRPAEEPGRMALYLTEKALRKCSTTVVCYFCRESSQEGG